MSSADVPAAPRRARADWIGCLAALAFVAAAALFWSGHVLDEEAVGFLRKYWSGRPFLQTVFDVSGWDYYQGRELSYAIDWLDAQWVRLLMSHAVLFFVPPSSLLASLAFVLIGWRLAPRALPGLGPATRWLGLLLLLSNFVFPATMGLLYRATKPVVAPLLLALLLLALAEVRAPKMRPRRAFGAAFAMALAMGLLDRQGLFYVLVLIVALCVVRLRARRGGPLLLGAASAVVVWYGYFRLLGPWVIHATNGYWPRTRFQQLRAGHLLHFDPWWQATGILGDWTSILFGRLPNAPLVVFALAVAAAWAFLERRRPRRVAIAAAVAAAALFGQVTMVAIMFVHHPPIGWISHRLWYYPLPYQAVVAFALLRGLELLAARPRRVLATIVPVALAGLVVLNVARWPEARAAIDSDPPFSDQLRRSALLVRALREGHAGVLLDGDHRRFYFECLDLFPRFAAGAPAQVGEGDGVRISELSRGRVLAWTERQAHLVARTREPGRYVLAGRAWLRAGDTLEVLLGTRPRVVAAVSRTEATDGEVGFRAVLELSGGANDVQLLSQLPEVRVPGAWRRARAGYVLQLPVLLWRDVDPRP